MDKDWVPVQITHPRTSVAFGGDAHPDITVAGLLAALQSPDCGFLEPENPATPYRLVHTRTGKELLPDQRLGEVGLAPNDVFAVTMIGQGA
ncbi:MAG: hypothetical protein IT198_08360 [Acidimicrobiia bacterium]|nr:hypothetical protein [Acidimicrobiia bacterium]